MNVEKKAPIVVALRLDSHGFHYGIANGIHRHDNVRRWRLDDSLSKAGPVHVKAEAQVPTADYFDVRETGTVDVWQRSSQDHVFPQRYEDPNVYECAHIQAMVAIESFAVAVDSASAIHRHQNIMVNGVSS